MAPSRNRLTLALMLALALIAGALYLIFARPGYERSPVPADGPTGPTLLDRAIEAQGGAERLLAVRTLRSHGTALLDGWSASIEVLAELPSRCRVTINTNGSEMVYATDGVTPWATFDQIPFPLDSNDLRRVAEQVAMARCGLLANLRASRDVQVEELGQKDGLDWMEVRFEDLDAGPFLLGFRPETARLDRLEWKSRLGPIARANMVMHFEDHREVEGVQVPFRATITEDGQPRDTSVTTDIAFNEEIPESTWTMPPPARDLPCRRRTRSAAWTLQRPHSGTDDEDVSQALTQVAEAQGLQKAGPVFHDLRPDGSPEVMGWPVAFPAARPESPAPDLQDGVQLIEQQPREALSLVIIDPDEAAVLNGIRRLKDEADRQGLAIPDSTPIRRIDWGSIMVMELPILQ